MKMIKKLLEHPFLVLIMLGLIALGGWGAWYGLKTLRGRFFSEVKVARGLVTERYKRRHQRVGSDSRTAVDNYRVRLLLADRRTKVLSQDQHSHWARVRQGRWYWVSYYVYDNTVVDIRAKKEDLQMSAFPTGMLISSLAILGVLLYIIVAFMGTLRKKRKF